MDGKLLHWYAGRFKGSELKDLRGLQDSAGGGKHFLYLLVKHPVDYLI